MKTYQDLFTEMKISNKTISGNSGNTIPEFDSEFKNKKTKKTMKLKASDGVWRIFDKGSFVSNLKGGIYVHDKKQSSGNWGILVVSNKENMTIIKKSI